MNRNVVVDIGAKGFYQGMNLCHRAVKNQYREIVKFLIAKCGADLSASSVQITVESEDNFDIEECDSTFAMILNEFQDPVEFLRDLFNSAVYRTETTTSPSTLGKTFTLGELGKIIRCSFARC